MCGGTRRRPSPIKVPLVYPRVCGGTPNRTGGTLRLTGLSPRVRGNQAFPQRFAIYYRSIPACAGEPWNEQEKVDIK